METKFQEMLSFLRHSIFINLKRPYGLFFYWKIH